MIYTVNTKKAMKICFEAHKEQLDKSGMPYVFHPFHVAEQMDSEATVITALLHDVVEDTDTTLDDFRREGFSEDIIAALALLTHSKDTPYMDYIAAISNNPIARTVKIADLKHNMDTTRLDVIDEKAERRLEKYHKALAILESTNDDVQKNAHQV